MADSVFARKNRDDDSSKKIEGFISKNRKVILTLAVLVIAAAVAVTAVVLVKNSAQNKKLAEIDAIEFAYTAKSNDLTDEEAVTRADEALKALESYTDLTGVAGVRANLLAASILNEKKDYEKAASFYEAAALADEQAYTAGIAYFNAASACEETGNEKKAVELYKKASEAPFFPAAVHAMFSAARVSESVSSYDEAAALYQKIVDEYAGSTLASLSQTRLIALKAEGKIEQ